MIHYMLCEVLYVFNLIFLQEMTFCDDFPVKNDNASKVHQKLHRYIVTVKIQMLEFQSK